LIDNDLDFESDSKCVKYGNKIFYILKIILQNGKKISLKKPKYGEFFCEWNKKTKRSDFDKYNLVCEF
jgi:hypothetical protein